MLEIVSDRPDPSRQQRGFRYELLSSICQPRLNLRQSKQFENVARLWNIGLGISSFSV
jgi:hypothetical protein